MDSCTCNHNVTIDANVLYCPYLPRAIPNGTDILHVTGYRVTSLCGNYTYLINVVSLDLVSSGISKVCSDFLTSKELTSHKGLVVDILNNNITSLPKEITQLKKIQWKLSGNPFQCDCDMIWMAEWFVNTTMPSGEHTVLDYRNVTCKSGDFFGQPIYTLRADKMDCIPHILAREAIIGIACTVTLGLIALCTAAIIIRQWDVCRWCIYKNMNKYIGQGETNEDLENTVFDAFIVYR